MSPVQESKEVQDGYTALTWSDDGYPIFEHIWCGDAEDGEVMALLRDAGATADEAAAFLAVNIGRTCCR